LWEFYFTGRKGVPKLPFSVKFYKSLEYTLIVEVILGVPFGYKANAEIRRVLEDFRDMVNFCIDYAYREGITSYAKLRKGIYEDWKKRWNFLHISAIQHVK